MSQLQTFYSPFDSSQPSDHPQQQQWQPAFPDQLSQPKQSQGFEDKDQLNQSYQSQKSKYIASSLMRWHPEQIDQDQNLSLHLSELQMSQLYQQIDVTKFSEFNCLDQTYQQATILKEVVQVSIRAHSKTSNRMLQCKRYDGDIYNEQWKRRLDKVIAARAFIYRGYGINYLKQQNRKSCYRGHQIDDSKFKSISGSMSRQTYRKLQSFLVRDCQQKLHSLAGYQMKLLQTLLLNCRSTLTPNSSQYFIQMVKITYNLQDAFITEQQAIDLYCNIYQALQRKIAGLRGHSHEQLQNQISVQRYKIVKHSLHQNSMLIQTNTYTPQTERQIIKEYIRCQSLSKIRDILSDSGVQLGGPMIRNVLRRVLRSVIRKLQDIMSDWGLAYASRMTDENIKFILQSSQGIEARKQLCSVFLMKRDDKAYYIKVYQMIKCLVSTGKLRSF